MIIYENYSSIIVPDSLNFLSTGNIVKPLPGEYYIQIPIQTATTIKVTNTETNTETSNNDTELTNGFAFTLSFLVLVSFVYLRKRRII